MVWILPLIAFIRAVNAGGARRVIMNQKRLVNTGDADSLRQSVDHQDEAGLRVIYKLSRPFRWKVKMPCSSLDEPHS